MIQEKPALVCHFISSPRSFRQNWSFKNVEFMLDNACIQRTNGGIPFFALLVTMVIVNSVQWLILVTCEAA